MSPLALRAVSGAKRSCHLLDFAPGLDPEVKHQEAVPRDRGENQDGPKQDQGIFHGFRGAGVSSEPPIIPTKARTNEDKPAISGEICRAGGTMPLTIRKVSGPIAPRMS